jgi:hypothetical protein
MFEQPPTRHKSKLWTYLPIAGILFAGVIAAMVIMGRPDPQQLAPVTGILHEGDPDHDWYAKYVTLESRGIKMAKSFAGKRMVIFTGVIENGGERPLDTVEVKLILINHDEPVFESFKTPVRPGPYTPPIPPLQSRAFTVYLDEFPGDWLTSRAEMEISGFRFASSAEGN